MSTTAFPGVVFTGGDHGDVHVTMVHLPGVNTPTFTWGRTKLPKPTQPVPPIHQPEVLGPEGHNHFDPAPGGRGAHGRFDDNVHATSPRLWLTTRPRMFLDALAGGAAAAPVFALRR